MQKLVRLLTIVYYIKREITPNVYISWPSLTYAHMERFVKYTHKYEYMGPLLSQILTWDLDHIITSNSPLDKLHPLV